VSLSPETGVSPLAQAPADRPTLQLEEWARQGIALLFGDRKLDDEEKRILRGLMEEIAMRAQAGGGIGMGGTPSPEAPQMPGQSPEASNAEPEEMYASEGTEPREIQ
jgi:hypothetical protein